MRITHGAKWRAGATALALLMSLAAVQASLGAEGRPSGTNYVAGEEAGPNSRGLRQASRNCCSVYSARTSR